MNIPAESSPFFTASRLRSIAQLVSLFVMGVGCLVLIGWIFNITIFKSVLPNLESMKSNTAILFVFAGLSLWLQAKVQGRAVAILFASLIVLVCLITLAEYILNSNLGIDELFFQDTNTSSPYPGRIPPITAAAFLLVGINLARLDRDPDNPYKSGFVLIVFVISMLALIGYLYGVSSFYQISFYSPMALHTAITLNLLSLGILFARPEYHFMKTVLADTAGGSVIRRFLPTVILLPIVIGLIRLWGQRLGLYDTNFGLAIMVVSLIITLAIFIWKNAQQLNIIDLKRQQIREDLRQSEFSFRNTLQTMMEGCQIIGFDWRYIYINDAAEIHNRRPNSELIGKVYMDVWPGIESTAVFATLKRCMEERQPSRMTNEFTYPDGKQGWFELNIQPTPDGILILSSDITAHKNAEAELVRREMKLTTLFEILPVGVSILDENRQVSYINPALKEMLDISEEGLQNAVYKNRKYFKSDGSPMALTEQASARVLLEKKEVLGIETGVLKENGEMVWTNVNAVPVDFPDWKIVIVTSNITERKQAEIEILKLNAELEEKVKERTEELAAANEQLRQLSLFDELTGLYNRRGFLLLAEEQLLLARRAKRNLLVFYADLDNLKPVNDQFGHATGDEFIAKAAQTINETFRNSDIKARIGGDEFIVLAIEAEEHNAQTLLDRLHKKLAENNQSMSVGTVIYNSEDELLIEDIMSEADQAMYKEKRKKKAAK